MSDNTVTVDVMSPDLPLRDLLCYMMEKQISHVQIPYSDVLSVHVAIMFDQVEASKLVVHLDKVTQISIHKANQRQKGAKPTGEDS